MSKRYVDISDKVDLLFNYFRQPNGKKYTYKYIERIGNVKSSTVSRIRRGNITEPSFRSIMGIAKAFQISMDYFSTPLTTENAREYLMNVYIEQQKKREC